MNYPKYLKKERRLLASNRIHNAFNLVAKHTKPAFISIGLGLLSSPSISANPALSVVTSLSFGNLIPKSGYCEISPLTGQVSSANKLCVGSESLGHYRILSTPNTNMRIIFHEDVNPSTNVTYTPKARLVNNIGNTTNAFIPGINTYFDTGTDGYIDIYVGGILSVPQSLGSFTGYSVDLTIDYIHTP